MARTRTRMPRVFVGHPFGNRFPVAKFRAIFQSLPFSVVYGNTHLQTKHLLNLMKSNIAKSDYSIFDLSGWNTNVALELGLAEGLGRVPQKTYFILLNTRRSREVPSDIRGLQRVEYTSYDFSPDTGLGDQLVQLILSREYWVKKIWKEIPKTQQGEKKRLLALKTLAHLRDHEKLTRDNLKTLARGTRLRKDSITEVMNTLSRLRLVRGSERRIYKKWKRIFAA